MNSKPPALDADAPARDSSDDLHDAVSEYQRTVFASADAFCVSAVRTARSARSAKQRTPGDRGRAARK